MSDEIVVVPPANQPEDDQVFLEQLEKVLEPMMVSLKSAIITELKPQITAAIVSEVKKAEPTLAPAPEGKKGKPDPLAERLAVLEKSLRESNIQLLISKAQQQLGLDPDLLLPYISTLKFDNNLVMEDGKPLETFLEEFSGTEIGAKYKQPEPSAQLQPPSFGALKLNQPAPEYPWASLLTL